MIVLSSGYLQWIMIGEVGVKLSRLCVLALQAKNWFAVCVFEGDWLRYVFSKEIDCGMCVLGRLFVTCVFEILRCLQKAAAEKDRKICWFWPETLQIRVMLSYLVMYGKVATDGMVKESDDRWAWSAQYWKQCRSRLFWEIVGCFEWVTYVRRWGDRKWNECPLLTFLSDFADQGYSQGSRGIWTTYSRRGDQGVGRRVPWQYQFWAPRSSRHRVGPSGVVSRIQDKVEEGRRCVWDKGGSEKGGSRGVMSLSLFSPLLSLSPWSGRVVWPSKRGGRRIGGKDVPPMEGANWKTNVWLWQDFFCR